MLILSAFIAACARDTPVQPPEREKPDETRTADQMLHRYFKATALERAVVAGDVQAVQERAEILTKFEGDVPKGWVPYVQALRGAAQKTTEATTVAQAAVGTASVITKCTACHAAFKINPEGGSVPEAPEGDDIKAQMQRHQFATDVLRVGILFSRHDLWKHGRELLRDARLEAEDVVADNTHTPVDDLVRKVRAIAVNDTRDIAEREALYAELLTTCAACHDRVGAKVFAPGKR